MLRSDWRILISDPLVISDSGLKLLALVARPLFLVLNFGVLVEAIGNIGIYNRPISIYVYSEKLL